MCGWRAVEGGLTGRPAPGRPADRLPRAQPVRTGTATISATFTFGGAAAAKAMASAMSDGLRGLRSLVPHASDPPSSRRGPDHLPPVVQLVA